VKSISYAFFSRGQNSDSSRLYKIFRVSAKAWCPELAEAFGGLTAVLQRLGKVGNPLRCMHSPSWPQARASRPAREIEKRPSLVSGSENAKNTQRGGVKRGIILLLIGAALGAEAVWRRSKSASPLECALVRFQLPSYLESAVARLKDLKSLRMNRYRKVGGGHLQTGSPIEKGGSAVAASCPPPLLNASRWPNEIQGAGCACAQKMEVAPCRGWRTKLPW